jgi:serine/threonine-protein kinase
MQETAGQLFGNYRLVRKIGEGGMGEVYLALQETTAGVRRRVALKRLLPEVASDRESIRMFQREMGLVARLSHPAVVHTYDFGQVEGAYFIAMEFIDGVALSRLLRRHPSGLPMENALRIAIDVCGALQHAHEIRDDAGRPMGVVHRDVSPQNILVSTEGGVKLADFGIARIAGSSDHSRAMAVRGKFAYMSPEQTEGSSADRRTDIFALGAVLYEMLTGIRAFARADSSQTVQAVRTEEPVPAHHVRADVPEALSAIASRALAKRREDRYETAAEMQLALEELTASLGVVASPVLLANLVRSAGGSDDPPVGAGLETELVPTLAAPSPREPRAAQRRARRTGETVRVSAPHSVEESASEQTEPGTLPGIGSPPAVELPSPVTGVGWVRSARAAPWTILVLGALFSAVALGLGVVALLEAGPGADRRPRASEPELHRGDTPAVEEREPNHRPGPPVPAVAPPPRVQGPVAVPLPEERAVHSTPAKERGPGAPSGAAKSRVATSSGATGRLLLVSEPDAVVRFRGRRICETPCTTPALPVGPQDLIFLLRDGSRVVRTVRVRANETARLRIVLHQ